MKDYKIRLQELVRELSVTINSLGGNKKKHRLVEQINFIEGFVESMPE